MRSISSFVVLGLLVFLVSGCRETVANNAALTIDLEVSPSPPVTGDATLIVTVLEGETPVNDAAIAVRGDMSHAGMVPVLRDVSGGTEGEYEMPFVWTMDGDWIVEVTVTLPDGRTAQRNFEFSLAGSPDDMGDMEMEDDAVMDDMDMSSTEDAGSESE